MKPTMISLAWVLWLCSLGPLRGDPFLDWYADAEMKRLKGFGFPNEEPQIQELEALKAAKTHEEAKEKLISYLLMEPKPDPSLKSYLYGLSPEKPLGRAQLLATKNEFLFKLNEMMASGRVTWIEVTPEEIKFRLKADRLPAFGKDWHEKGWKLSRIAAEYR